MRGTFNWRLMRVLVVCLAALVVLFVAPVSKRAPEPRLLAVEEYRLLSPRTYRYVLNQPAACRERRPFLVFMVPVAPHDAAARDAVRTTWGSPGRNTMTLFYVGLPEGGRASSVQEALEQEHRKHADIIQMTFRDSYQNLTIKTMMMMNWVASHCPNASYIMKVDADVFVNVFYLIRWLRGSLRRGFITGSLITDGKPRREWNSKWRVSEEEYPDRSFPTYLSGAGYVFSADLAERISWASRFVRLIPLEDVYVGLCLRVLGVRPVYSFSLLPFRNLFELRKLEYNRCVYSRLLIVNGFHPSEILRVWEDFSKYHRSCSHSASH